MERFSLSNFIMPISHQKFVKLTQEFKTAAERAFGTECKLIVQTMKSTKEYSTFIDENSDMLHAENEKKIVLRVDDARKISENAWRRAAYVEAIIKPRDATLAPHAAFAHAEFKGTEPRTATFYCQQNILPVELPMIVANPRMWAGNGNKGNGRNQTPSVFGLA